MILAFLVFVLYFAIGLVAVLGLWALKIRYGNSSDLDPESFLVRWLRTESLPKPRPVDRHRLVASSQLLNTAPHNPHELDWGRVLEINTRESVSLERKRFHKALREVLMETAKQDFGKHVIKLFVSGEKDLADDNPSLSAAFERKQLEFTLPEKSKALLQ